jgi:hypothetical protein
MAVMQLTVRDTRDQVRGFLEACGVDVAALHPAQPAAAALRLTTTPISVSFTGFAPLAPRVASQRVLDALDPDLGSERHSALWGSSAPLSASIVRVRSVTPADPGFPHVSWYGTGGELLDVCVRMNCRGIPNKWFRVAATQARWTQLLWVNDDTDPAPWSPQQYGGIFASWDGDHHETVGPRPGVTLPAFLAANQWVSTYDFPVDPLPVVDPALWDRTL